MRKKLTEPFGKAGLTVAILALVMALVGGAYAAGGLTKSQEKQVTKIAKRYAGKPGVTGANGTNGTNGSPGAKGAPGEAGEAGKDGVSITNTPLASGSPECPEGGSKFVGTATTKACNGSPWTAGGVLPKGATETGTFYASQVTGASAIEAEVEGVKTTHNVATSKAETLAQISFPVQLAAPLDAAKVHYVTLAEQPVPASPPSDCAGGKASEPKAAAGSLCIYEGGYSSGTVTEPLFIEPGGEGVGAGKAGVFLSLQCQASGSYFEGTWAVTAP